MPDLKTDLLLIKRASYESLIFPAEERDKFLAELIGTVRTMSPNGEGIFPGRLSLQSPVPHHTLSCKPHYTDDQTGRVSQAEAVAFETLWRETDIIKGHLFNAQVSVYDAPEFKRIFKIGPLVNKEKVSIIVWAEQKGMDWFYQELLAATFVREAILGEFKPLIDLHKDSFNNKESFIYPRMKLFKPALEKDQMIIGKNVVAAAASLGFDWKQQHLQKYGPEYAWQGKYKKKWNESLQKGFDLAAKLYRQVLDHAINEGLMTKFKTGSVNEVFPSALLK